MKNLTVTTAWVIKKHSYQLRGPFQTKFSRVAFNTLNRLESPKMIILINVAQPIKFADKFTVLLIKYLKESHIGHQPLHFSL